jgi:glutamyl-tRNA reductase
VRFPDAESVILSTCNRVELYVAGEEAAQTPTQHDLVDFLAEFHSLENAGLLDDLTHRTGEHCVRHLFTVAASLDSMVVGEAQILSQVKQAYELARQSGTTGPFTDGAFQAALRVAKRVATETAIQQKRVSIPSVAVADFARGIFERFDDKHVLVIGAGEMGEETLVYLVEEGARDITVINRNFERAAALAEKYRGRAEPWESLTDVLVAADLVISTTGASEPIVTAADYRGIERRRAQRPLFVLDLAMPRDFDPAIGTQGHNVYLYSIDDLRAACEANRQAREEQWPAAERIIEEETQAFLTAINHRTSGATIQQLKALAGELKEDEIARLQSKLGLDERTTEEVRRSFERMINKLFHAPLQSLREEAAKGPTGGLLDALKRLFRLE